MVINVLIGIGVFALLSALLAGAICICSKVFYVENDPRYEEVLKNLPGANCGGCGYAGCSGFANAIISEGANPRNCKPNKQEKVDLITAYIKATTGPNGEYIKPADDKK